MPHNAVQLDRRAASGFTLVELVIVILIIGILGAIAAPRFAQANARQQLDASAKRLIADMKLAQSRARASSQAVTITFKTERDSYSLDAVGGDGFTVELDESPYGVEISQVSFTGGTVIYNGFGVPDKPGYVVITSSVGKVKIELDKSGEVTR